MNMDIITEIVKYYQDINEEAITKLNLSQNALHHFKQKISFLRKKHVVADQLKRFCYWLNDQGGEIKDKMVLDVGCGTGYISIYLAIAGAKEVVSVEMRGSKIEAFKAYISFLPDEIKRKIKIIESSITDIEYVNYFDIVYAQEAISHINSDSLFYNFYEYLNFGGILYISDGNNSLCNNYKKKLYKFWLQVENGPSGKCGTYTVEFIYKDLRKELISQWYSQTLNKREIIELANNTAGLYGDEIKNVCKEYLEKKIYTKRPIREGFCPVHPELGYYLEKLFNPYTLSRELQKIGFKKTWKYGIAGIQKPWFIRILIKLIPLRIKYALSPFFVVMAKK